MTMSSVAHTSFSRRMRQKEPMMTVAITTLNWFMKSAVSSSWAQNQRMKACFDRPTDSERMAQ